MSKLVKNHVVPVFWLTALEVISECHWVSKPIRRYKVRQQFEHLVARIANGTRTCASSQFNAYFDLRLAIIIAELETDETKGRSLIDSPFNDGLSALTDFRISLFVISKTDRSPGIGPQSLRLIKTLRL